jgi:molecular chaperone HtpG
MARQYKFKAEIQQLLDILIHSLYTNRDIFLRELVSNASDALNRLQFEQLTQHNIADADAALYIEITPDEAAGTLTISDTGAGMTREELVQNLGVIAHSGAKAFIEALQERQQGQPTDIIGQFGVGFYSAFMVADRIRVVSKSWQPDEPAHAWESTGGETFSIEPTTRETRGTDIILHLKEDAKEYLQTWKLRDIVRQHSNFVAFPIHIGDDEQPANEQTAIWRQESKNISDEQYNEFYRMLTLDFAPPAHRIHMRADVPLQFYALLYVPAKSDRLLMRQEAGLKLFARKVLIEERTTDLLPEYLQFVVGVVDSEDLPLAVSRENIQSTRVIANLKKTLTNKVLSELKRLYKSNADTYREIFGEFGRLLKQGVTTHPQDAADLTPILLFRSSKTEGNTMTTLGEYVERMVEGQNEIYYVLANDENAASQSPHLDAFNQRGIEVLYLVDVVDPVMLMGISEFQGHALRNVDESGIDLSAIPPLHDAPPQEALAEDTFAVLRGRFAERLGDKVQGVRGSSTLVASTARLVSDESGAQRNMFRINRLFDREYTLPVKTLELNTAHPLMHNLSRMVTEQPDSPLIDLVIDQVFETALLQEGIHPDPSSMAARLTDIMKAATDR